MGIKVATIIDCFADSKIVENNLLACIKKFKVGGHEVFVVSNTPLDKSIIEETDFFFYDKRNQLFKEKYTGIQGVDFWHRIGDFTVHNIKTGFQKHGLSVLINLFNSLEFCKRLGYTHFQRIETDDLFGSASMAKISRIPYEVDGQGKKGLFYFNYDNNPKDISFHYFYCEIDYFLNSIINIRSESDYQRFLLDLQGNLDFRIVENFIFENLETCGGSSQILKKNGKIEMESDFPDTIWNTVTSQSNLDSKYRGCVSEIYESRRGGKTSGYVLYSHSYVDRDIKRTVLLHRTDGSIAEYRHDVPYKGAWAYVYVEPIYDFIEVFEGEEYLYSQSIKDVSNYIEFN